MKNKDFRFWLIIIEALHDGHLTRDPYIRKLCRLALDGHTGPLKRLLERKPSLLWRARRNLMEIKKAIADNPYWFDWRKYDFSQLDGEIFIANGFPYNVRINLKLDNLTSHLGGYGRSGVGKTTLMRQILEQLLGMKNRDFNIIIFDVKRDYQYLIKEFPALIALRKKHIRYAHFEVHEARNRYEIEEGMKDDAQVLSDALYFGATGQPIIESAVLELFEEKGVYDGTKRWPTFTDVLKKIEGKKGLSGPRTSDVLTTIKVRFDQFIKTGEVFDCERGYPLSFWLNNDIVIDTKGMSEIEMPVFANGLTMKIFKHNMAKNIRGTTPKTVIFYDEGYHFFDAEKDRDQYTSNEAIKSLFRKGREFRLAFLVTGTQITSISRYVRENTSTIIGYKTQDESLLELLKNMGLTDEQKQHIYQLASKFQGIIRLPDFPIPLLFDMEVDSFPEKDVTIEDINERCLPIIEPMQRELKRRRPIIWTLEKIEALREEISNDANILLEALQKMPFLPKTDLRNAARINDKRANKALDWLMSKNLISSTMCWTSKKRKSQFFPITVNGHNLMNTPDEKRIPTLISFDHSYYCEVIRRYFEGMGFEPKREWGLGNDRVDIFVDLSGIRTALEMTLSFQNLLHNITKCFIKLDMQKVSVVCENKGGTIKAEKIVSESEKIPEKAKAFIRENITFSIITDFF